jgi:hypothetical protein
MFKGAILIFAFTILFFACTTKTIHPPLSSPPPPPVEVLPEPPVSDHSLTERKIEPIDRSEVRPDTDQKRMTEEAKKTEEEGTKDLTKDMVHLTPPPELPSIEAPKEPLHLPDLAITDLFLSPKKRVTVTMSNMGDSPLPMELGNLKIFIEGQIKGSYRLDRLFDQSFLQPKESITFTSSLSIRGRREVQAFVETSQEMRELNVENNHLENILEGLPIGPDIIVQDLDLTEDFDLNISLSNAGEVDLRKGVPFRIRVFVNGLKVSDFDHFIPEGLKANFGNCYTIDPPHRIGIGGTAKVKVSISPKLHSDDVYLGNNILERTFAIFPFQMVPQGIQEFSFFIPSPRVKENSQTEKIKAEVRWEGEESSFLLSFSGQEQINSFQPISDHSPLKLEFPIHLEEAQSESQWRVSVANLMGKKVEGCLIIQHP